MINCGIEAQVYRKDPPVSLNDIIEVRALSQNAKDGQHRLASI